MTLAGACYYHPSPFGSGPPVWGCDMGTFPDPPTWLIDAAYLVAAVSVVLGIFLVVLGRNPLPIGPKGIRSAIAMRLQGLSVIVGAVLLAVATTALAESRGHHLADPIYSLVSLFAFPLMAALWALAWFVDRRRRPPKAPQTLGSH